MRHELDSALPQDTSLEAMRAYVSALRKLGPGGRARLVFQLSADVRRRVEAGVRHRHPEYGEREVRLGATRVALGEELFRRVCPEVNVLP